MLSPAHLDLDLTVSPQTEPPHKAKRYSKAGVLHIIKDKSMRNESLLNYVPYVLSCPTCLVPYVLSYSTCPRASCPTCSRTLRASCPTYSRAPHASCPMCFLCPRCSHAPRVLRALVLYVLVSRTIRALVPYVHRALCALVPYMLSCLMLYVFLCLTCFTCSGVFYVSYMFLYLTCLLPCIFFGCP